MADSDKLCCVEMAALSEKTWLVDLIMIAMSGDCDWVPVDDGGREGVLSPPARSGPASPPVREPAMAVPLICSASAGREKPVGSLHSAMPRNRKSVN
jgi:hypothetical protein